MGLENLRFQSDAYAQGSQAIANVFQKLRELDDRKAHARELATLQKALSNKSVSSPEGQEAVNRYMANVTNYATIAQQDLINSANQIIQARRAVEQEIKAREEEEAATKAIEKLGLAVPSDYQSAKAQTNNFLAEGGTPEQLFAWSRLALQRAENLQLQAELNKELEKQRAENQLRLFNAQLGRQEKLNKNQILRAYLQAVAEQGGNVTDYVKAYNLKIKEGFNPDAALFEAIKAVTPDKNIQKAIVERAGLLSIPLAATLYNQEQNRNYKIGKQIQDVALDLTERYDKLLADKMKPFIEPQKYNSKKMTEAQAEVAARDMLPLLIGKYGEYEAEAQLDNIFKKYISDEAERKIKISKIINEINSNIETINQIKRIQAVYQMRHNTWEQPTSPTPTVIPNSTNPQSVAPTGNTNVTFPTQINTSAFVTPAMPESTTTNPQSVAPTFRLNTNIPINASTAKSDATMVVPNDKPGYINPYSRIDTSAIRSLEPIFNKIKIKDIERNY